MKVAMVFPLEQQALVPTDNIPRVICMLPIGAKVVFLGQIVPSEIIGIVAMIDPFDPNKPPELVRSEFIIVQVGGAVPDDFVFRAPVRTRSEIKDAEGKGTGRFNEGLLFVFEKPAQKSLIMTAGGRA